MSIKGRLKKLEDRHGTGKGDWPRIVWVRFRPGGPDVPQTGTKDWAVIVGGGPPNLDCHRQAGETEDAFVQRTTAAVDHFDATDEWPGGEETQ